MIQPRHLVGIFALATPLLVAGWAMATPLNELDRPAGQGPLVGSGYVDSDSMEAPQGETRGSKPSLSGSFSAPFDTDGFASTAFEGAASSQDVAQNWLRVRSHSGSSGDWPALTTFGVGEGLLLDDTIELSEDDGEGITVDELARRFVRQEARRGRALLGTSGRPGSSSSQRVDLGLNLVRNLLDHKMDRELALAALSHTTEIREFLLQVTASDNIADYETVITVGGGRTAQRETATVSQGDGRTVTSGELERIKASNEGSAVQSLKDFLIEFLADFRIIFFFGASLALILLLSAIVSRWVRA